MSEKKSVRLNKLAKEFNVSMDRILSFLENKGLEGIKPSSKIPHDLYMDLLGEFQPDLKAKIAADIASKEREAKREEQRIQEEQTKIKEEEEKQKAAKIIEEKKKVSPEKESESVSDNKDVEVLGKIDLDKSNSEEVIEEENFEISCYETIFEVPFTKIK